MEPLVLLAWLFTGLLLLLVVVCLAAGRGAIPVNHFLGIRIPALKRSEAAWRAGHSAGVGPALGALAVGLFFSFLGLVAPVAYWGSIVAFAGGVVWVFIRASRAAKAA
jgi:hypothetical protein